MGKHGVTTFLAVGLFLTTVAAPRGARAGAVEMELGAGAAASTWQGDAAGYGTLRGAYRFARFARLDVGSWNGRGRVDDRHLGMLILGASFWLPVGPVRPYARAAAVHQHEEPETSRRADPTGSAFGVADGIRHRGGAQAALGLDVPVMVKGWTRSRLLFGAEVAVTRFPDQRGPELYVFAGGSLGISYDLL